MAIRCSETITGYFLSPLCTVCYWRQFGAKFDVCKRFLPDLQQLCLTPSYPQFTVFLDDLEASGAENSDSYSDISVSSVHTCDLTNFDEDFSVTVTGVPNQNADWSGGGSSLQWFGTYIQSNFTYHRLNCFIDLLCVCFSVCFA